MKKFLCILSTVCVVSAFGQVLPQKGAELYNSNDWKDIELSYDGNRAVFSDPYYSNNTGVVRINEFVNGNWSQIGNDILGDDTSSYSAYAVAISDSGNRIALTQQSSNATGITASVRVYEDSLGNWVQVGSEIPGPNWICELSGDGTRIAVGEPQHNSQQGRVRIFEDSLGNWIQIGSEIVGDSLSDHLGRKVKLSQDGSRIITGAFANENYKGQVKVFEDSAGTWVQVGNNLKGDSINDRFGYNVSISDNGSIIAIGATKNFSSVAGYARVFEESAGSWVQLGGDIFHPNNQPWSGFGYSISVSGDGQKVVVSGGGTAVVYELDSASNWIVVGQTTSGYGQTYFSPLGECSMAGDGESFGTSHFDNTGEIRVYYTTPCSFKASILEDIDTVICANTLAWVKLTDNYSYDSIYWSNGDVNVDSTQMTPGSHSVYVSTSRGCDTTFSFQTYFTNIPPSVQLLPIDTICPYGTTTVSLSTTEVLDSISWSNGQNSGLDSITLAPGQYSVYYENSLGCFYTKPFNVHYKDTSNVVVTPCYIYCDLDTGLNRVVIETPNSFENLYEWQLQEDFFGVWTTVSARPATDTSEWYHSGSNPFNKAYTYRVRMEDSCGVIRTQKTTIRTVLLQSSLGTNGEVNLNWNAYEGADVWYYVINRKQGQNFVVLDSVGATTTTYIDNNAPSGNVSYYVTAVRQSPCGSNLFKSGANTRKFSSNTVSESVIGIDESSVNKISIHPNPTSGLIQVQLDKSFDYEVYDLTGKLLAKDSGKEQIDISKLPAGTYTVIITSENRYSNHIVQKL
jgi:hypothetical protein